MLLMLITYAPDFNAADADPEEGSQTLKGTVHQMYECCSEVLLHLGRMLGIVFMVQRGQIWPKNTKTCFDKMYPVPLRSAAGSFEKCRRFL